MNKMVFYYSAADLLNVELQSRDDVKDARLTGNSVTVRYFNGREDSLTLQQADEFLGKRYHWLVLGQSVRVN